MATDFDKVINRKGTHSLKYDFATVRGKKADILPLWVADMDFQAPKSVRERLFEIVEHYLHLLYWLIHHLTLFLKKLIYYRYHHK